MSAGYSGTPLAKKLGIKPGHTVARVGRRERRVVWVARRDPEGTPLNLSRVGGYAARPRDDEAPRHADGRCARPCGRHPTSA
jgi:hypothetical protein